MGDTEKPVAGNEPISENPEVLGDRYIRTDEATLAALFETIMVSSAPVLANIIKQNPGIVHSKLWHGVTLLHKLCMRGDETVVSLMLQNGADPNAETDGGETPLHYACRKGRLPVVVVIVKAGGDAMAVDSMGHNCMHYATQGGAITVLVYMHEMCGLDYNVSSNAVQTPLHVAAIHGHWPTAAFLLRKQRCQVDDSDIMGNTALHLAAQYGHLSICWQIIESRGSHCLTQVNSQKQKPLDMAMLESTLKQKEAQHWLKQFTEQQAKSGKVASPTIFLFFNFLYPIITCCFAPAVISWLFAGYQCFLYIIGLVAMMRWLAQQDHRLHHPSRWPNPARAGVFVWGITANLICYFYFLQPFHQLHWMVNWASWSVLFIFLLSLVSFFQAKAGRYSYETTPAVTQSDGRITRDWSGVIQATTGSNFCDECELIQEYGIRHCRMCGACFRSLDHHCLFLLRCVTASNGRYFLFFLASLFAVCSVYVINIGLYLHIRSSTGKSSMGDEMWHLLVDNTLVLIMFLVDLVGMTWALLLSSHQVQTLSQMKRGPGYPHGHSHKHTAV